MLRGDGENDSLTDGQCGRCGGAVDQAGGCQTCDSELPKAVTTPWPPTEAAAGEVQPQVAAPSSESSRSDAVRRFGWDPSTDEMIAPPPAREPEPEPSKPMAEAALPAPELEALFAALESSPIRIKPQEPEPPAAPAMSLPFARPYEIEALASSSSNAEIELSLDTMELPAIAPQPTIAPTRAVDFEAPVAPEPAHVIDEPRNGARNDIREVPAIDQLLAAHDLHAAMAAAAAEPSHDSTLSPANDVPASSAIEEDAAEAPIAPIALKAPAPIETPTIVSPPPVVEPLRAIDLPMPIATVAETPALASEGATPLPLAAPSVVASAPAITAQSSAKAAPSIRWRPLLTAGATVAILAVIGVPLSKLWLERSAAQPGVQPAASRPAPQHTPAPRSATAAPTPTPAALAAPSPAPRVATASVPVASTTVVAASPRPTTTERTHPALLSPDAQVPPRPARPMPTPAPTPQPAPQVAALAPAVTAPSVAALPAATAEPEPAPAPPVAAATPAAGPFFELNDVDSPPKVTARADTDLPAAFAGQPLHEIVVVRVLVSQTGRPALVSLLRHSKAGLALDEAVIAAVKQWTFTPAMKRGQSVSCFYHVAVTVSQQ